MSDRVSPTQGRYGSEPRDLPDFKVEVHPRRRYIRLYDITVEFQPARSRGEPGFHPRGDLPDHPVRSGPPVLIRQVFSNWSRLLNLPDYFSGVHVAAANFGGLHFRERRNLS